MGEDKAGFSLAGTTMIERAMDRLRPQVSALVLSLHQPAKANHGLPVTLDAAGDHQGPLAGILAALRWAETSGLPWVATVAVDTPFFPKDLVYRLKAAARDKAMAVASSGGRLHPVFGLWRSELAPALRSEMGKGLRSARQFVALHDAGIADWPSEPYDPFFNINQPDDVSMATRILTEFAP
jgi:molybdopterin-guanine dinucleotide biosynthesis protein A